MRKFFLHLMILCSLAVFTPAAQASISVEDQRVAVYDALDFVISDLQTQITTAQTTLAGLPPTSVEARILTRDIMILNGRLRLLQSVQLQLNYLSGPALNSIITRFDLPVSLS